MLHTKYPHPLSVYLVHLDIGLCKKCNVHVTYALLNYLGQFIGEGNEKLPISLSLVWRESENTGHVVAFWTVLFLREREREEEREGGEGEGEGRGMEGEGEGEGDGGGGRGRWRGGRGRWGGGREGRWRGGGKEIEL